MNFLEQIIRSSSSFEVAIVTYCAASLVAAFNAITTHFTTFLRTFFGAALKVVNCIA
jgi:hypothetical protein